MGCRVLDGGDDGAVLYDSTSMVAFGPVFRSAEHAEDFLEWLAYDPRRLTMAELGERFGEWHGARCDADGDLIARAEDV